MLKPAFIEFGGAILFGGRATTRIKGAYYAH